MRFFRSIYTGVLAAVLLPQVVFSQTDARTTLMKQIKHIADTAHAKVGVAVIGLDFSDTILLNANKRYPMQSVYKFPIALAVLDKVDKGLLSLDQNIHLSKSGLDAETWSPMVKDHPNQDIDISLRDLLKYVISASDNNGCDVLIWLADGCFAVNNYIHGSGINGIAIAATEKDMHTNLEPQYSNWCEPMAMAGLLRMFYEKKVVSKASTKLLKKLMTESENSPDRIKGQLPQNIVVAHKTGTSFTDKRGVTAATNDVGIVTLPNGKHYAIVVYVSEYKGGVSKGEHVISGISKLVWDYLTTK